MRVVVVSVEPYTVGATSEVVVVCVDDAGVSTNVQLVRRLSAPSARRLMVVDFMVFRYGSVVALAFPTAADWAIPHDAAIGCNPTGLPPEPSVYGGALNRGLFQ